MALFKAASEGSWWLSSKSDPRWDCQGTGFVGSFSLPPEAKKALEEKKKELGEGLLTILNLDT